MKPDRLGSIILMIVVTTLTYGETVPYQSDFPPEEFQARWKTIFDKIGDRALAIVPGVSQANGFIVPRQSNEFYHLCGIETPHAYLILDGRDRRVTLLLSPRDARLESAEGKVLSADDADLVRRLTGVDMVMSTKGMTEDWVRQLIGSSATAIYAPFAPAEGNAQCRGELRSANAAIARDPWDGRPAREAHLVELLKSRFPKVEVRDLTPILDELRAVKSAREIALVRRASQLAGRGLIQAMKCSRPGVFEYQLDAAARYVFQVNGARFEGYRSITASGTDNIWNMHYYRNTKGLQDGELVLMDFAPEYHYYTSDIARMWPVSGKFNPEQRELLQFVLDYRNCVLKRIKPGVTPRSIQAEAKTAMEAVFARTKFSRPIYETAARRLVNSGGGVFSHPVGMAVHDDGRYTGGVLKPGHVFSIDPQLRVPEEKLYYRYEDVIVITDDGYENFTSFLPTELDEIEKLVGHGGMLEQFSSEDSARTAGPPNGPVPVVAPPASLGLDPFYTKYVSAHGLPVVGSAKVSDFALREAVYLVDQMLAHRPDIREAMKKNKIRVAVMAYSERTTDIPEHRKMTPKPYWDFRARGLGASPRTPVVSCAEENLLNYPGDPYSTENILIHEFGHGIDGVGLRAVDPTFRTRLREAYRHALDKGLWKGTYAASNPGEYWAEGVQSWFDTNRQNDSQHNHVDTREELRTYDPELAKLCAEVFGDGLWRYVRPDRRKDQAHLTGFDRGHAPSFVWEPELLEARKKHYEKVQRDSEKQRGEAGQRNKD
jgi:Xaa-Pro aminopeptidase